MIAQADRISVAQSLKESSLPLGADHRSLRSLSNTNLASTRTGHHGGAYTSFRTAAIANDTQPRVNSPIAPSIISEVSASHKKRLRRYKRCWWFALAASQLCLANLAVSAVYLSQNGTGSQSLAPHLIWFLFSAVIAIVVWGTILMLWLRRIARRNLEKSWAKAEAVKWRLSLREKGKEAERTSMQAERLRYSLKNASRETNLLERRDAGRGRLSTKMNLDLADGQRLRRKKEKKAMRGISPTRPPAARARRSLLGSQVPLSIKSINSIQGIDAAISEVQEIRDRMSMLGLAPTSNRDTLNSEPPSESPVLRGTKSLPAFPPRTSSLPRSRLWGVRPSTEHLDGTGTPQTVIRRGRDIDSEPPCSPADKMNNLDSHVVRTEQVRRLERSMQDLFAQIQPPPISSQPRTPADAFKYFHPEHNVHELHSLSRGGHGETGSLQSDDNFRLNHALENDAQSLDEEQQELKRQLSLQRVGPWIEGTENSWVDRQIEELGPDWMDIDAKSTRRESLAKWLRKKRAERRVGSGSHNV